MSAPKSKSANELLGVGSRAELERETTGVRIIAIVGFSVAIVCLFFALGLLGATSRLFLLTLGHLIIAPVAAYASLRLGFAILLAIGLVVLQTLLDVGQLILRTVTFQLPDFLSLFYIVILVVFLFIDIAYLITLWRLRTTIKALDARTAKRIDEKSDPVAQFEKARDQLLQQESNTIRVTALFGLVGAAFLILPMALLFAFQVPLTQLALLTLLHIPVAIYALMFSTRHTVLTLILTLLAAGLLVVDFFVVIARLTSDEFDFSIAALGSIVNIILLMIAVLFVLVDVVYIIGTIGLVYAHNADNPFGSATGSTRLSSGVKAVDRGATAILGRVNAAVLGSPKQD